MSSNEVKFLQPGSANWINLNDESNPEEYKSNKSTLNDILLSSMQMQNIIVLAGSGTSLGLPNAPSMSDLWDSCVNDSNGNISKNAKTVLSLVKHSETEKNIESLLSKCEAYLQFDSSNLKVIRFLSSCKKCILEKCSFEMTNAVLQAHNSFIHKLSRRRTRDSRLKLFTTNYDTCFEYAASNQGIVTIDGFSYSKPRIYDPRFFDYDIIRRKDSNNNHINYLEGVFQLYKLHGSINWYRNEGKIIEGEVNSENVCMIFPAKGKYQQSYIQPHLELMARYLSSLRESNTCLVISGFGFNDDHLSEPIISAIESNPHLKVIIADYSAEKAFIEEGGSNYSQYWSKLFKLAKQGEAIWFINSSFEEFSKLIPDLRSLTPAENLSKNIKNLVGNR